MVRKKDREKIKEIMWKVDGYEIVDMNYQSFQKTLDNVLLNGHTYSVSPLDFLEGALQSLQPKLKSSCNYPSLPHKCIILNPHYYILW